MNADTPKTPGEELEARITAMLLGELPESESAELRHAIARDAELGRLHDRLKRAIALLEEALHSPEQENPEPLRLAPERREQVLQSFKVLRPVELRSSAAKRTDFRTWGALAAMILGLLAILPLIPGIGRTRFAARDSRKPELMADVRDLAGREEKSPQSGAANAPTAEALPIAPSAPPADAAAVKKDDANGSRQSIYLFGTQPLDTAVQNRSPGKPARAIAGLEAAKGKEANMSEVQGKVQLKEEIPTYAGLDYYRMDPTLARRYGALPEPSNGEKDGKGIAAPTLGRGLNSQPEPSDSQRENLPSIVVSGRASRSLLLAPPKLSEPAPLQDANQISQSRGDNASNLQMGRAAGNTPITRGFVGGSYGGGGTVVLNSGTPSRDEGLELPKNSEGRKPAQQLGDLPALGMTLNYQQQLSTAAASDFGVAQSKSKPAAAAFDILTTEAPQSQPESPVNASATDRETRSLERETSPAQNKHKSPRPTQVDKLAESVEAKKNITVAGKPAEPAQNVQLDRKLATLNKTQDSIELRILQENAKSELDRQKETAQTAEPDIKRPKPSPSAPIPQPEIAVTDNAFSTFSLNVSDVSFKLAGASLDAGQMPDPATVRSEEFVNAFDYRDPEAQGSAPIAFAWERARYPFAHDRDLLRLSLKTAAAGRESGRPLNIVLLLDNSGSMERADRVGIIQECIRVLAAQLQPQDRVSVVAFARTARLWVDALPGSQAGELPARVGNLTPQGGTNLEEAMKLAYQTALRHYLPGGVNRVVLLTDGAANLGDLQPESLKQMVEKHRRQGVALDCFGIGWEGLNDDLLETLSRNGDGRYGFVNTPEEASTGFAGQLAGALQVAASDVKVQVEFNPRRTTLYRQIGYAKHQLTKEQFRDNTVDAAELGAAEAGNALYIVQVNPGGEGPLAIVRVRFKIPGTEDYREHEWPVPYEGVAKPFEQASAALRLAGTAAAFSEWLVASPYAAEVTPARLLQFLSGVPENWPADPRPRKLESMIRQANSIQGKR